MYQFYSEGFFGYGEYGDFQSFGFWHFLPIALCVAAVILTAIKREAFCTWKKEKSFRYVLSFVMLMAEMSYFWRILYVGDEYGTSSLMSRLPMQLCQWGLICCVYMIISLNDSLFSINFFVTLVGATIAIFMPIVITRCGPAYFRYYQFWLEHLLPIYCTLYAMIVHKKRPKYRYLWISYFLMLLMAIPASIANLAFPEANYFYLKLDIPFLPESYFLRVIIYSIIIITAFHLLWFAWCGIDHWMKKKEENSDGKNSGSQRSA